MKGSLAAPRYARALFKLAESTRQTEQIEEDLRNTRKVLDGNRQVTQPILSSSVARNEKEIFIDRIFARGCTRLTIDFLKVLIKKKRFSEFQFVQEEYHELFEKKMRFQEAIAITAVPLSKAGTARLIAFLQKMLHCEIRLILKQDPKILGGLIIRVDEFEIDGSYQSHLKNIKQRLLSSYEGN